MNTSKPRKKLTYTLTDLRRMSKNILLNRYPAELLTESQLKTRIAQRKELERCCVIYEHESGKKIGG